MDGQPLSLIHILDIGIPKIDGLEVIARLKSLKLDTKVLVLTRQNPAQFAPRCLQAGAMGFVSKRENLSELLLAAKAVLAGYIHFPTGALRSINQQDVYKRQILDLAREYEKAKDDPAFQEELAYFQRDYVGRPSPLYFAERLTEHCGGAKIYLKREELNHTGAHKINNCIGQILLARRMGCLLYTSRCV